MEKFSDRFQNLSGGWNFSQLMSDGLALFQTLMRDHKIFISSILDAPFRGREGLFRIVRKYKNTITTGYNCNNLTQLTTCHALTAGLKRTWEAHLS